MCVCICLFACVCVSACICYHVYVLVYRCMCMCLLVCSCEFVIVCLAISRNAERHRSLPSNTPTSTPHPYPLHSPTITPAPSHCLEDANKKERKSQKDEIIRRPEPEKGKEKLLYGAVFVLNEDGGPLFCERKTVEARRKKRGEKIRKRHRRRSK